MDVIEARRKMEQEQQYHDISDKDITEALRFRGDGTKGWQLWACYRAKSMINSTMNALRKDLGLKTQKKGRCVYFKRCVR